MGTESPPSQYGPLPEGVEIRKRQRADRIRVTFNWLGARRRETLNVPVNLANIRFAGRLRAEVVNAIARGVFNYAESFPDSKRAALTRTLEKRYLVNTLIDNFVKVLRDAGAVSPSTVATYAKWATCRLKPEFHGKYLNDLDTPELRLWIARLVKELAPKSVRNCIGILSSVLNQAVGDGLIKSNPLSPIKLKNVIPKKRREDDKVDPFNSDEVRLILDACPSTEERAFFQFAFAQGTRPGENIAVKWSHVDWQRGTITIQDNVVSAEKGTVEKDTKTGHEREIPLLAAGMSALVMMKPLTYLADGYIFNWQGVRWRSEQQVRARWRAILKRAGVKYRNPYQTRHTFASTLLMNGEPELVVANMLGHRTVEMVRRHYGRFIKEPNGIVFRGDYSNAFGAAPMVPPKIVNSHGSK